MDRDMTSQDSPPVPVVGGDVAPAHGHRFVVVGFNIVGRERERRQINEKTEQEEKHTSLEELQGGRKQLGSSTLRFINRTQHRV